MYTGTPFSRDLPGAIGGGAVDHHDLIQERVALHQGLAGDVQDGADGGLLVEGGEPQADGHPLSPLEGHQFLQVGELLGVEGVLRKPLVHQHGDGKLGRRAPRSRLAGEEGPGGPGQDQRLLRPLAQGAGQRPQTLSLLPARSGGGTQDRPVVVAQLLQHGLGDLAVQDHLAGDAGELPGQRSEGGRHPSGLRGRVEQGHLPIPGLRQR